MNLTILMNINNQLYKDKDVMPTEKCQRKDAVRKSILAIDIVIIVVDKTSQWLLEWQYKI